MKRISILAAVLALLGAGTAQAKLTKPEARHAISRYLAKAHKAGENEGFAVNDCHRRSKSLIWCHVVEYGLTLEGYDHGNLFYRIKAKKRKGKVLIRAAHLGQLEKPAPSPPPDGGSTSAPPPAGEEPSSPPPSASEPLPPSAPVY